MSKSIITKARLTWLRYLAAHGETTWDRMPRRKQASNRSTASLTNRTWRPMQIAGLIEAKYYANNGMEAPTMHFKITDAGLAAIALATGEQHEQI